MKFTLSLLAFSSLTPAVFAFPAHTSDNTDITVRRSHYPNDQGPCVKSGAHVIAAPGEGLKDGDLDLLQHLTNDVVAAIPGSDYVQLVYPLPENQTDFLPITAVGTKILHSHLESYTKRCPKTKIVLLGYSAGAVIVMNTLCGQSAPYEPSKPIPASYAPHVVATVVYGDESREPGQSYDKGTCLLGHGTVENQPRACSPFAPNMVSYCDEADGNCCTDGVSAPRAHYKYPEKYDRVATDFVVRKFKDSNKTSKHQHELPIIG